MIPKYGLSASQGLLRKILKLSRIRSIQRKSREDESDGGIAFAQQCDLQSLLIALLIGTKGASPILLQEVSEKYVKIYG